ncbi:hypothetical protein JL721_4866 [Aureococcus anophagefferens]|nr:hypothetical protein JL721_4866 [Aureococcus anophagefferens]
MEQLSGGKGYVADDSDADARQREYRPGTPSSWAGNAWAGAYEEKLFKAEATAIIGDFAAAAADGDDARLFLYYASHLSHTPMQVEQHVLDAFLNESATLSLPGLGYAAMTNALDAAVANVTAGYRSTRSRSDRHDAAGGDAQI